MDAGGIAAGAELAGLVIRELEDVDAPGGAQFEAGDAQLVEQGQLLVEVGGDFVAKGAEGDAHALRSSRCRRRNNKKVVVAVERKVDGLAAVVGGDHAVGELKAAYGRESVSDEGLAMQDGVAEVTMGIDVAAGFGAELGLNFFDAGGD